MKREKQKWWRMPGKGSYDLMAFLHMFTTKSRLRSILQFIPCLVIERLTAMGPMNGPEATAPGSGMEGRSGLAGSKWCDLGGTGTAEDCGFFGERCAGTLFGPLDAEDEEKVE